jgi:hypothetical protein
MVRRMKVFIAALALLSPLAAQADLIRVHGIDVDARNIEYFVGSNKIHSFSPASPVIFPFARGNAFPSSDTVYLREDGSISVMVSRAPETLEWKLADSRALSLDCGMKRNGWGDLVPRIVSFHENGEYKNGCALTAPFSFRYGPNSVEASGSIDLHSNLSLAYAGKILSGKLKIGGKLVDLLPGTEIAFHANGLPNFFTLAKEESFRSNQGQFGELLFAQNSLRPVSTTLFEDGSVEKGILGKDMPLTELGIIVPAGSGIGFSLENGKLSFWLAILSANQRILAQGNPFTASRVGVDQQSKKYEAVVAETFTFKGPDGQLMDIPPGSIVTLSDTLEILSIRVPAKEEKPFPRKQLSL